MKKVEAIIRADRLEDLKDALSKKNLTNGMTVSQVLGHGKQRGFAEYVRGQKVKVEIVVCDALVDDVVSSICQTVRTGDVGDGKIFIIPVDEVIRIRTGEKGRDAL